LSVVSRLDPNSRTNGLITSGFEISSRGSFAKPAEREELTSGPDFHWNRKPVKMMGYR
jgi:hypothetical protein